MSSWILCHVDGGPKLCVRIVDDVDAVHSILATFPFQNKVKVKQIAATTYPLRVFSILNP